MTPRPVAFDTPTPSDRPSPGEDAYDITIPPTLPTAPTGSGWQAPTAPEATYASRRDAAWLHTVATGGLVSLLLGWTATRGEAPGLDAQVGVANLVLHFGVWITGWLALDAATDAWLLHRAELDRFGAAGEHLDRQSRTALALAAVAAGALIANTAMVLSALVS